MVEFRGAWTEDEVAEFFRDATIPIRLAVRRPDGTPWVVPLWYRYRDGRLECATSADATLVSFLRADSEVAFDVSTNEIPYRGVRGYGSASLSPDEDKAVLRSLLERYLEGTDSPLAERLLDDERDEVHIRIEPHTVFSWDYSNRMRTETDR
ncbi:pyridoxamine 5'-phosphate oxidase family protein [Natronolimnohabitans innermongolicus]|uniref:Pyridoxamine 5'-phosphate oxidase-related FMN-binding protein n=1 Tax=Natronolimnohabitans innermongolicus JCM 12255 TaxID=1227499 RepID=L9WUY9_9EURY|nr:pyridoxamine 5'-phosphate oxidase family protein [Natronolimnohabitans innermongolicus]ELY53309.1 pyridoxamine 5'-phosphate oxidase-related FMN-binding protein [Natronolimnohabitans innermongolicus JCM 12255]